MNDNEILPEKKQPEQPGSEIIAYLFKRISALEDRIAELESKNAVSAEKESVLISKADSAEKKLDMLIEQLESKNAVSAEKKSVLISKADSVEKKLDLLIQQIANPKSGIEDIGGNGTAVPSKPETQTAAKKKQVAVFIDGENISHKKAKKIIEHANTLGSIEFSRVYGVQNNNSDKCWIKTSGELKIKHIRLAGGSKKNKVDKKMFEEILNEARKKDHAAVVVIATNDTDFVPTVKTVKGLGVRVVIMGLESTLSDKMKKACNSYVYL